MPIRLCSFLHIWMGFYESSFAKKWEICCVRGGHVCTVRPLGLTLPNSTRNFTRPLARCTEGGVAVIQNIETGHAAMSDRG
jgi:hypothetical protein